jgi:LPXTG-motif cell wall-anchored protein
MPYCDYNGGGIEVGTSRFAVKDSSQMEAVLPNDDTNPTINENAWAADCGFAVDSADETTKWLTSTVTQHLGKVEIGLSKTVYGSTKSPNTKPNAVGNEEEVCWSVLVENKGTTALEDYVISDEIQEPYRITSVYAYFGTTEAELKSGNTYAFLCSIRDYDKAKDTFWVDNQRLKVNGDPIKIQADTHGGTYRSHPVVEKDPSFYIAIVRDTVSGKLRVNVRLAGPTWAVQSGTYTDFRFWTEKPDDSRLVNKTYTNTAWLTPLRDDLGWDGTATKGVIDKKLSAPYWDKTRTSIRSSANVMVSYGYSTSSSIAVSQTDPADHTVYSTSSDEADTTTILPDKNDKVHYTLTVDNTVYASPQALTKLVLINNLPQEGDHNPFQDDDMRGSEYQMSLTEGNTFTVKASIRQNDGTFETKVIDPKYIKIQYSKDVSFDGDDWNGKESVKWTTNPEGARSFRIIIDDPSGAAMPAHSKVTVEYDAKADTPDSIEPGQTAYNSFGYHYEVNGGTALEAAPSGVGLRTPYVPTLQKRLETPDGEAMAAGADAKFNFVIYDGAAVTLQDGFTESDLAAALSGYTYAYVEKTVAQGQMESDAPWLKDLKQYSYEGNMWKKTGTDWTWQNGKTYHVIELPVTGDYRYGSINRSTARSYSFTYNYANKNTLQCVNIGTSWAAKLTKTEEKKPGIKLQDAYFALYSPVKADQMAERDYNALTVTKKPAEYIKQEDGTTWYLKSVKKTGVDGTLTWAGLSESEYLYVEVQAPNGYNLDSTVRKVPRPTGGGTASVSVTNRPGYNLPETGGIGTWPFMTAGLLLTGTALALLLKKRKTNN